jgi:hypothetical protein
MDINGLALDMCILYISSYAITWFFAIYLNLGPLQLFAIFCFLQGFNGILQTYILPIKFLAELRKKMQDYRIMGIAILALLVGPINVSLLAGRFGWPIGIGIGLGSFLVAPLVYNLWSSVIG